MRETATRDRCGLAPAPRDPDTYSAALPLIGVESREEARMIAIRYGSLTYDDREYVLSIPEFDGTVDGVFAAQDRLARDLGREDRWA